MHPFPCSPWRLPNSMCWWHEIKIHYDEFHLGKMTEDGQPSFLVGDQKIYKLFDLVHNLMVHVYTTLALSSHLFSTIPSQMWKHLPMMISTLLDMPLALTFSQIIMHSHPHVG